VGFPPSRRAKAPLWRDGGQPGGENLTQIEGIGTLVSGKQHTSFRAGRMPPPRWISQGQSSPVKAGKGIFLILTAKL
jgi:hypothetical protein